MHASEIDRCKARAGHFKSEESRSCSRLQSPAVRTADARCSKQQGTPHDVTESQLLFGQPGTAPVRRRNGLSNTLNPRLNTRPGHNIERRLNASLRTCSGTSHTHHEPVGK